MKLIPEELKNEIALHTANIKEKLKDEKVEAVLVGANANIYYSTGRFFRGFVFISAENAPLWFVMKPMDFEEEENVRLIRKPEEIPSILQAYGYELPSSIALEVNDLSYSEIERLKALFPDAALFNGSLILKKARMVKTPWEIDEIRQDGLHQANVYAKVKECYHPGISDLGLQIEIERNLRLEGSLGVSRVSGNLMEINLGSVVSGENADSPGPYEFTMGGAGVHPVLPVGANDSAILSGTTIMIDMNGAFNGYQSDMTRVWCLGQCPDIAQKAHSCSIRILRELERVSIPGMPVKEMYEIALRIVNEEGLQDYFMGHKSQVGFIGHGVGIQLNELPVVMARSKDVLKAGMTIALEPKFVIPHVGAVGVENTYVVTEDGLENLTVFPEEIQKL